MSRKTNKASAELLDPQVDDVEFEATVEGYLGDYDELMSAAPALRSAARRSPKRASKRVPSTLTALTSVLLH